MVLLILSLTLVTLKTVVVAAWFHQDISFGAKLSCQIAMTWSEHSLRLAWVPFLHACVEEQE